ncbi:unnamed protein product [Chrysoparadoxa australica]
MDRLAELRAGSNPDEVVIDVPQPAATGGASAMDAFFESVDAVKADIDGVKAACKQMDSLTEQATLSTSASKEHQAKEAMNKTIAATNKRVAHCKALLQQAMREETEQLKREGQTQPAEMRVRENLQNTLTRKFVDLAKDYQNRQNKYKTSLKKKAERTVRAVKPTVTDDEMTAVFDQEDGVQRVLEAAVLQTGDPVEVTNVLQEVQDTYQDVKRLESSIIEIHKMFMDLALLVEQQGELLDQIEYQTLSPTPRAAPSSTSPFPRPLQSSKTIRKRQCCMIGIVLVIILIIVIAVVFLKS